MRWCESRLATVIVGILALASLVIAPRAAIARDEPVNKAVLPPTPSGASSSSPPPARPLEPGDDERPLPPGHPAIAPGASAASDAPDDEEDEEAPAQSPHAAVPGMFQPPPDSSQEDPLLPPGTLAVEIRNADDKPIPNVDLVLVVLHQSVAKGQNKENRPIRTDSQGHLVLAHLEMGSSVSYWVKDIVSGATFASSPVQLGPSRGVHQVLHAYPVARDLESAMIVVQGIVYFEIKDDRVQVEEALTFFNFGKTAWFPENFVVKLPSGFTALTSQAQMSDQGIDPLDKVGAKIRGTFAPGRHDLDFRWQLPYDGEKDLTVDVNLPPHVAIMRVMAAAGRETKLDVTGFPEPQRRTDRQGQKVLITEKQVSRDAPLSVIHVSIRGLTTVGPARYVACGIAGLTILMGLFFGIEKKERSGAGAKSERAGLLAEIEELERARRRGDVGPKTYERARRELVDAIAETLDPVS